MMELQRNLKRNDSQCAGVISKNVLRLPRRPRKSTKEKYFSIIIMIMVIEFIIILCGGIWILIPIEFSFGLKSNICFNTSYHYEEQNNESGDETGTNITEPVIYTQITTNINEKTKEETISLPVLYVHKSIVNERSCNLETQNVSILSFESDNFTTKKVHKFKKKYFIMDEQTPLHKICQFKKGALEEIKLCIIFLHEPYRPRLFRKYRMDLAGYYTDHFNETNLRPSSVISVFTAATYLSTSYTDINNLYFERLASSTNVTLEFNTPSMNCEIVLVCKVY